MLARQGFPERGPPAQAGQPQGLAADSASRPPIQACACPLFCPPGPTGQASLLLLLITVTSPPRARLAQEWSLPSGARSEDVTGLTICLPNRQGVGAGRGFPQPKRCPPPPGGLPTLPCSCRTVLSAASQGSAGVPPGPHLSPWAEEARVQRERQGQQRGGAPSPPPRCPTWASSQVLGPPALLGSEIPWAHPGRYMF